MVTVVFGARGNVGRHVAAGLLAAGEQVRLTSRNPSTARFPSRLQVAAADLEEPGTLPALAGAENVFLYAKPAGIQGFVEAARAAGVRHVLLLSSAAVVNADAGHNPIARQHRAAELAIEQSGIDWTFVRPGMFAANTRWWWTKSIRAASTVRMPYPEAQTAPVHEKDMAALAVAALTEPGHGHQAYTVYGPESLTLRRQAGQIGDAIGREIRLEVISREQAQAELSKTMPPTGACSETIRGSPPATGRRPQRRGHPARSRPHGTDGTHRRRRPRRRPRPGRTLPRHPAGGDHSAPGSRTRGRPVDTDTDRPGMPGRLKDVSFPRLVFLATVRPDGGRIRCVRSLPGAFKRQTTVG
jgi:uncharacterized protein YbjT (DUF2867 family)